MANATRGMLFAKLTSNKPQRNDTEAEQDESPHSLQRPVIEIAICDEWANDRPEAESAPEDTERRGRVIANCEELRAIDKQNRLNRRDMRGEFDIKRPKL